MASPLTPDADAPCLTAWLRSGNRASLGDLEAILRDDLGEFPGVPGADNPIGRRRAVVEAVNEVAKRTHCLHGDFVTSIVAGQAVYCQEPSVLLLTGLLVKDPSGIWRSIGHSEGTDAARMKAAYSYLQRAGSAWEHDWQYHASFTVGGALTLYPTPATNREKSLWVSGYFMPGKFWELDPDTLAPRPLDPSHECPLPDWAIEAVKRQAVLNRARQLVLLRPDVREALPLWEKMAMDEMGRVESTAVQRAELLPRRGSGVGVGWAYAGGWR